MKILFCDFLFQRGNRHVDSCMIDIMAQTNDVYLLMNDDFLQSEVVKNVQNIKVLGNKLYQNPHKLISYRIQIFKRMALAAKVAKNIKPDLIYISTYRTSVFPFGLLFFSRHSKIVVVENNNIDELKHWTHRFLYKSFANKVHHLVYESFFKDYLVSKIGVKEQVIHVVPHFQYKEEKQLVHNRTSIKSFDCIAISWSNDENLVRELVKIEEEEHPLERNNINLKIKCRGYNYSSDCITIDGEFIPKNEYDALYSNCKLVLVPFPLSYKYRMSGCIVDAFSNHKVVVSTELELSKFYESKYGPIINTCRNAKDILFTIVDIVVNRKYAPDSSFFVRFENDHGINEIKTKLNEMIKVITKN